MSQEYQINIPDDLHEKVQSALGRDIPKEMTSGQAKSLAQELSSKAPALSRPFAELLVQYAQAAARNKPSPKTLRPKFPLSLLYVKEDGGNWVLSRSRIVAAAMGSGFLVLGAFMYSIISSPAPSPRAQAPSGNAPAVFSNPTNSSNPGSDSTGTSNASPGSMPSPVSTLPAPPSDPQKPQGSAAGGETSSAAASANASSPLPAPPPDLPPPPDYQAPQATPTAAPDVVVWRRQGADGQVAQGSQEPAVVWSRSAGNPSAGSESEESPGYWKRENKDVWEDRGLTEKKPEELLSVNTKQAGNDSSTQAQEAQGYWKRGGEAGTLNTSTTSAASSTSTENKDDTDLALIWKREQPKDTGGVISPASQSSSPPLNSQSATPSPSPLPSTANPSPTDPKQDTP